jgi:hypothetical protein
VEPSPRESSVPDLAVGVPIEVRSHFHGDWTNGFEIAETTPDGFRLRRLSDRTVLPTEFPAHDIRRTRPHRSRLSKKGPSALPPVDRRHGPRRSGHWLASFVGQAARVSSAQLERENWLKRRRTDLL